MTQTGTAVTEALVIRRTFNAPRDRVFDAWCKPDIIRTWMGGPDVKVTDASFEAREGGGYRFAMLHENGEEFIVTGIVSEFRRPERLAFTFRWLEDDPEDERDTYVSIDFAEHGNGTEMTFRQENFASDVSRDRHNDGWTQSFDLLNAGL